MPITTTTRLFAAGLAPMLATGLLSAPARAGGVRAGTIVRNTAQASFDTGNGQTMTVNSNTVELRVDEVLDIAVAARDAGDADASAGQAGMVRAFTVTNAGNGAEAVRLTASGTVGGNGFDPAIDAVVLDTNGNGVYEPAIDLPVSADGSIAALEPDAAVIVFIVATVPISAGDGRRGAVALTATAAKGSGAPGTVFAGQGFGGGDAIVGATRATGLAQGGFVVQRATVSLVKSATVLDPFGGARAMPGSRITYRIEATVGGTGGVAGLHVTDTIPAGTTYLLGTLSLDGAMLSDAVDGDAGRASAAGIDAALGTPSAGQTHAVQFTVAIN